MIRKVDDALPSRAPARDAAAEAPTRANGDVFEPANDAAAGNVAEDDVETQRQARRERALQAQHKHEAEAAAAESSSADDSVCSSLASGGTLIAVAAHIVLRRCAGVQEVHCVCRARTQSTRARVVTRRGAWQSQCS